MSVKMTAAAVVENVLRVGSGPGELNVTAFCNEHGTTPKTFYKWVRRYRAEGNAGLEDRSRRPKSSPHTTPLPVEDLIVRLRKELDDAGLDHGPTTIVWHLGQRRKRGEISLAKVPSESTVWRILVRRGLIIPEPKKRPKTATRRFEAPAPNEWWQMDATDWVIATGGVKIFNVLDDHSRLAARSRCVDAATSEQAWITFCEAAAVWGLPAGVLSDNGLCFSGKLRGFEVEFESRLRDAGIRPLTGRPYHPQTTGKVERFQQTLKKWLRKQPLANSLAELQTQLDTFCVIYNFERPHQGISRKFPGDRWRASPASGPAAQPLAHPDFPSKNFRAKVSTAGSINNNRYAINVGVKYSGQYANVIIDKQHANIFIDNQLIRHLKLDPTRRYQPSGRPPGRPPKPVLQS